MTAFDGALAFTIGPSSHSPLGEEGGWSDNPADPGGATFRGVTLRSWRNWTGNRDVTAAELRTLTQGQLAAFYGASFWNVVRGDDLPAGVSLSVFDHAVNAGVYTSALILQRCVGAAADGHIGPLTLAATAKANPKALVVALGRQQDAFYRSRTTFPTFGKGWLARLARRDPAALAAIPPITGA